MLKKLIKPGILLATVFVVISLLFVTVGAKDVTVLEGKVIVSDTASSISASGNTVTATAKGSLFSAKTNTITIKNNSGAQAQLSFDYTASNANSFTIAGASAAASGSCSVSLAAGGTYVLIITSKKGLSGTTATLTLSNIVLVESAASSDVTFQFDSSLGSVTVAGAAVNSGGVKNISGTSGAALVATPVSGSTFLGWVDASNGKILSTADNYTLIPASDMTVKAAFAKNGGTPWFAVGSAAQKSVSSGLLGLSKIYYYQAGISYLFDDLNAAANFAASSGTNKAVVLMNNGTLSAGDYTIPAGVTLLIPFDNKNTMFTTEVVNTKDAKCEPPNAYRTLTMADGANLIINGAMSISAKQATARGSKADGGSPTGPVGFVRMEGNSSITVNNAGKLYAYGFITGSGSVTANSGATVYEMLQFMDFRGGTQSTDMDNGVFPFSQYYVQNIEVPITFCAGATEMVYTTIYMSSADFGTAAEFIGGKNAMFNLTSGTLVKRYDGTTDRLVAELNGEVTIGSMSLDIGTSSIDSSEYDLPLNGNISVVLKSGSSVLVGQDIVLIPGAELTIEEGATCSLKGGISMYVYDADEWGTYCGAVNKRIIPVTYAPGRTHTRTEADLVDAKIVVKGTLDASAGYLYTTAGGANICGVEGGMVKLKAGTQTVTYQLVQNTGYTEIPITSAKLKNADGSYAGGDAGEYTYTNGSWDDGSCKHANVVMDAAVEPTCSNTGLTEGSHCSDCNAVIVAQEEIAALGHTEAAIPGKAATCTETGLTEGKKCSVCGTVTVAQQVVSATGHSYDSVVTEPTCDTAGYTTYTCSACSHSYTGDVVEALGHSYTSEVTKQPTCTEEGVTTYTCGGCGNTYTKAIAKASHSYNAVVTEPTCTDGGYATYTCSTCGDSYVDDEVSALGHSYKSVTVDATCTEDGYTTYTCSACGDSYVTDEVSALGHSYDDGVVTKDPTCYVDGVKTYTCTGCGGKYTEAVPATGHSFTDWAQMTSSWNSFYTICEGCDLRYLAELEYRMDDYVWLNLLVMGGGVSYELGLYDNPYEYIFYEPNASFHYFLRQINAKDISTPFTIQLTSDGQKLPVLDVSFATYKALLEDLYEYELARESTTDTRRATIAKMQVLLEKMVAYGDAAAIYFDEELKESYNADESKTVPNTITLTGAKDVIMGFTQGAATGVTGASLKTASAKVYFDEALRMSVLFKPTLPTGFDTKKIVKIGLLASPGIYGDTGTLTVANHDTMYVLYSLTTPEVPGGSENYPDKDNEVIQNNANGTITDYDDFPTLNGQGRWELCFDLTNDMYNQVYELRPFMIVEDETGTHYVYGEQVHYSLAAYISRTYGKSTDKAFKNLLAATWDYVVAADAAF